MSAFLMPILLLCIAQPSGGESQQRAGTPELPKLVLIPGGTFAMGTPIKDKSNEEYHQDEAPMEVTIDEFFMAETPVTAAQLCAFLNSPDATEYEPTDLYWHGKIGLYRYSTILREGGRYVPFSGAEHSPANQVTWKGAVLYCSWLSKVTGDKFRLPTEAEWEYAARGRNDRRWPWGNEEPDETRGYRRVASRQNDMQAIQTSAVGGYPPGATPDGVMDLLGYVIGEWCINKYVEHPTPADVTNTLGDVHDETSDRVVRGYYHRNHRSIGTWKGAIVYRLRGTTHPGRLWTRRHDHPIRAPRSAARYGFRIVKESR